MPHKSFTLNQQRLRELSDADLAQRVARLTDVANGLNRGDTKADFEWAVREVGNHEGADYHKALKIMRSEQRRRQREATPRPPAPVWTPFHRAYVDPAQFDTPQAWERYRILAKQDGTRTAEEMKQVYMTLMSDEHYINSRYQVTIRRSMQADGEGGMLQMVHLSVKRLDQQPIHDWRDMQRIKNELVGEECEGIELFPAESRTVDTSNQYHIWCVASDTYRWPVGWNEGQVKLTGAPGTGQREFEK